MYSTPEEIAGKQSQAQQAALDALGRLNQSQDVGPRTAENFGAAHPGVPAILPGAYSGILQLLAHPVQSGQEAFGGYWNKMLGGPAPLHQPVQGETQEAGREAIQALKEHGYDF